MKINQVVCTVFILSVIVKCDSLCPGFSQLSECDCSANINLYYHIYRLQCPKIRTMSKQRIDFEIYTSKYESRLTTNCNHNGINQLINYSFVFPNITKFKTFQFNDCFKNHTVVGDGTADEFNLANFVNRTNIKIDDFTLQIILNEFSFIDVDEFFDNFSFQKYFTVLIKNIGFYNKNNNTKNILFTNLINTIHLELINNYEINFDSFASKTKLTTLTVEKSRIVNFNKLNLAKLSMLYNFQCVDCEFSGADLNADQLFKYNNLIEFVMKNITIRSGGLNSTSNTIVFNENLFGGVQRLRILTITNNDGLVELPAKLFAHLNYLFTMDLSQNRLTSLSRDMFKYNNQLRFLNLSGNHFAILNYYEMFQQIKSLRKLYLNDNLLTKFYYNASGQNYFNELHLHNNQISYDEDTTCPVTSISARFKINLSSNKITNAVPLMNCFVSIPELTEMNLENNSITSIEFKPLMSNQVVFERLFDNLKLMSNNITSVDILDELNWEEFSGGYKKTNLIVDLDLNPLFCENCVLLKQMFNHSFIPITSDYGTVIRFQHPTKCKYSVFCDEEIFYDHNYVCPESCSCRYNEFSRIILIECIDKGLTEFPIIDYTPQIAVDSFILNFKGNRIKNFTTNGQNPEVFRRLKSINLEDNLIDTFSLSLVYNKVNEIFLQNNRLQITNAFIKQLNDREILLMELKVTLSGNNYCDHFDNATELLSAVHFNLVDRDLIKCEPITTSTPTTGASGSGSGSTSSSSDTNAKTSYGKIWVIPVFFLMLVAVIGYLYYRTQVGNTTTRFINRLRYRKANVEFESNLIEDES